MTRIDLPDESKPSPKLFLVIDQSDEAFPCGARSLKEVCAHYPKGETPTGYACKCQLRPTEAPAIALLDPVPSPWVKKRRRRLWMRWRFAQFKMAFSITWWALNAHLLVAGYGWWRIGMILFWAALALVYRNQAHWRHAELEDFELQHLSAGLPRAQLREST